MKAGTKFFKTEIEILEHHQHEIVFAFEGDQNHFIETMNPLFDKLDQYIQENEVGYDEVMEFINEHMPQGVAIYSTNEDLGGVGTEMRVKQDTDPNHRN